MAKIYGLFGALTGKLADVVMSVRNGEQIARKYQPIVYNPSTPAQVAQRAKLKLLSQISAVMAPHIAIPRQGSVSSRNLFTKKNFPLTTYATDTASINTEAIQLTNSVIPLSGVSATFVDGNFAVALTAPEPSLSRVVYVAFSRTTDQKLRYNGSIVVSTAGNNGTFPGVLQISVAQDSVVYAYGVRDNTEAARVAFGDLTLPSSVEVASLIVNRTLTESDVSLTETMAVDVTISAAKVEDEENQRKKK